MFIQPINSVSGVNEPNFINLHLLVYFLTKNTEDFLFFVKHGIEKAAQHRLEQ